MRRPADPHPATFGHPVEAGVAGSLEVSRFVIAYASGLAKATTHAVPSSATPGSKPGVSTTMCRITPEGVLPPANPRSPPSSVPWTARLSMR